MVGPASDRSAVLRARSPLRFHGATEESLMQLAFQGAELAPSDLPPLPRIRWLSCSLYPPARCCRPCRLQQCPPHVPISLTGSPRMAFPRALRIARTQPAPTRQMPCARKAAHRNILHSSCSMVTSILAVESTSFRDYGLCSTYIEALGRVSKFAEYR